MAGFYEFDSVTNVSMAESFNEEQNVYDTPYDELIGNVNCEPLYVEPPDDVGKIYESIDGQRNYKLHREDVRFDNGVINVQYSYSHLLKQLETTMSN